MTITELTTALAYAQIAISITAEGGVAYRAPKGALTPALAHAITAHRGELLAAMRPTPPDIPGLLSHSQVLGCEIFILDTDTQAQAQREAGQVAYSAREVRLLQQLKARQPEDYDATLRTLRDLQTVFGATIKRSSN